MNYRKLREVICKLLQQFKSPALDIIDGGRKDEPTDRWRQDAPPTPKDGRP
jgi:hypothetical protein